MRNGCGSPKGGRCGRGPPARSAEAFGSYTFKMQFKTLYCAAMNIWNSVQQNHPYDTFQGKQKKSNARVRLIINPNNFMMDSPI